jgi:calpain-7
MVFANSFSPYPEEDEVWERLHEPFHNGDVLITLGTPSMSRELEELHGLIGSHNYAVLDLKEENGERKLLIKNPWCESPDSRNPNHEINDAFGQPGSKIPKGGHLEPGHFWMSLFEVFQKFRVMYVNWNPSIFKNRQDLHFNWDLTTQRSRTFVTSPQFSITSETGGTVWLLLGRHLQDGVLNPVENPKEHADKFSSKPTIYPRAPLTGYISMFMVDCQGTRIYIPVERLANSPFLDGLQTFLSFKLEKGKTYTLAIKGNAMPLVDQNFTLSAYSHSRVNISHAKPKYPFSTTIESQWRSASYGVPSKSGLLNPQFLLTVPSPTSIAAFLDCEDDSAKVNLKLCKRGERILNPKRLDILVESHVTNYELGGGWFEIPEPCIGSNTTKLSYTLLVLNMDEDFLGKFSLRVETDVPVEIKPIPNMYSWDLLRLDKAVFSGNKSKIAAPMLPCSVGDRIKVLVRFDSNFIPGLPANPMASSSQATSENQIPGNTGLQSLLKITLEAGFGANSSVVATTSVMDDEFRRVESDGLLLSEVNVWRDMTREPWDMFLVIERSGGCNLPGSEERFVVDVLTENYGTVRFDKWRGWED